jgi:hypothetical protein
MAEHDPYDPFNPGDPYNPYNPPAPQQSTYIPPSPQQQPQPVYQQPGYQQPGYQQPVYPQPVYPQPDQTGQPPRKNRTVAIVLGIIGGFILCCCLSCLGLYLIGSTVTEDIPDGQTSVDNSQSLSDPEPAEPTPAPTPPADPKPDGGSLSGFKKVGNEEVGYVEIPESWVKFAGDASDRGSRFADVFGEQVKTTQFSSASGDQIITLYAIDTDAIGAKAFDTNIFANMDMNGYSDLRRAMVDTIPGYTTYVAGGLPDDRMAFVCWCFEDGLGKTHYIALDAPRDSPNWLAEIPQTFTLE